MYGILIYVCIVQNIMYPIIQAAILNKWLSSSWVLVHTSQVLSVPVITPKHFSY